MNMKLCVASLAGHRAVSIPNTTKSKRIKQNATHMYISLLTT